MNDVASETNANIKRYHNLLDTSVEETERHKIRKLLTEESTKAALQHRFALNEGVSFTGSKVQSGVMQGWIWRSSIAGVSGWIVHSLFMYFKWRTGLLPSFQPYQSFQIALSHWVGTNVPAFVPWAFSFLNGMTILGFLFARINRFLPGRTGVTKGVTFGLIGWVLMGLIFYPLIGLARISHTI
jgi:hypothetical protein